MNEAGTALADDRPGPMARWDRLDAVVDRIGSALFVLNVAFLAFVAGAMMILGGIFPSHFLLNAYRAGESLLLQQRIVRNPVRSNLWKPARTEDRGMTSHDALRAVRGYTLYTSGDDNVARLITMDGRVVHEWRRPYSTVWNKQAAARSCGST